MSEPNAQHTEGRIRYWTKTLLGPLAVLCWLGALLGAKVQVAHDTARVEADRATTAALGVLPLAPAPIAPGGLDNRTLAGQMRDFHHVDASTSGPQSPHTPTDRQTR